jgi:Fe-S cluster assembly protein SufD
MAERIIQEGTSEEIVLLNEPQQTLYFKQQAGSTLRIHLLHIPTQTCNLDVRDYIHIEQTGKGCLTEIYALTCLQGNDNASLHTQVMHSVGGGESKQVVKFILTDTAKGEFYGELKISQDAQKTNAEQQNRNLLLSEDATMRTRPQLEIYADDVKCSHGATVGKLNEDEQFYMRSRGIPEDEAKVLQMISFAAPVLSGLEDEILATRIENAIRSLAI